jgi:hypothetical protein
MRGKEERGTGDTRGIFNFRTLGARVIPRFSDGIDVIVRQPTAGWMNVPVAGCPRHALQPGALPVLVVFFAETANLGASLTSM